MMSEFRQNIPSIDDLFRKVLRQNNDYINFLLTIWTFHDFITINKLDSNFMEDKNIYK